MYVARENIIPTKTLEKLRRRAAMGLSYAGIPITQNPAEQCMYHNCQRKRDPKDPYYLCRVHSALADVTLNPHTYMDRQPA